MSDRDHGQEFFEASVRFETLIWLPAALPDYPEDFKEFCEHLDDPRRAILEQLPELRRFAEADEEPEDIEEVCQELIDANRRGLIACVATPVMRPRDGVRTFSWGHYNTVWLYGDTLDQLTDRVLAWAAERRASEDAKAAAAAVPNTAAPAS